MNIGEEFYCSRYMRKIEDEDDICPRCGYDPYHETEQHMLEEGTLLHERRYQICDDVDESARIQIKEICDKESFSDSKIRIMPDVHAGKGCTIGTTIICTGKGNPEWNYSAPHGAGRILKRF